MRATQYTTNRSIICANRYLLSFNYSKTTPRRINYCGEIFCGKAHDHGIDEVRVSLQVYVKCAPRNAVTDVVFTVLQAFLERTNLFNWFINSHRWDIYFISRS